jgi:hypothetical protein
MLGDITAVYHQDPDSCSEDEDYQKLTIQTDDAGAGKFFIISTQRWAFSDIDELVATLADFKKRSGIDVDEMITKAKKNEK